MRQLFIDSRDRVSGTSADFSIQLPETLRLEGGHRGRIDHLRVPQVIPTIRTGVNDVITVLIGVGTYVVSLPQGNYDGTTLATTLQYLLTATTGVGVWIVSYDNGNVAMTISNTVPFTIVGGTFAAQLKSQPFTQTARSYSFSYVSILGVDVIYLASPQFTNLDTIGPAGAHDTLMSANVTTAFGSVLDASMPYDTWFDIAPLTVQQLSFSLRDRKYNLLNIIPDFSFVLTID